MSTELAVQSSGALAVGVNQSGWTDEQLGVLRHLGAEDASQTDYLMLLHQSQRTGLDPFSRQIYLVKYGPKWTIQTGIDGFRLIARRAADKAGYAIEYEDTEWCGVDGIWRDVWLSSEPPAAARAVVLRDGKRFPAVCLTEEFKGLRRTFGPDRKPNGWETNDMWTKKPSHMIEKCAEAAALRKAFPQDLSGLLIPEEADHLGNPATIHGEVIRDDAAGSALPDALAAIETARTPDDLNRIWQHYAPHLSLAERGQFKAAGAARLAALKAATPEPAPESQPEPSEPPSDAQAPDEGELLASPKQTQQLAIVCGELGYGDRSDRLRLVGRILGREVTTTKDLAAEECAMVLAELENAKRSPDPIAWIENRLRADA